MDTRFSASLGVEMVVPEQPIHITNYLRQPQRVVNALAASSQIERLDSDLYRLKMRSLNFMTLSIQPIVDMRVWANEEAAINIQSAACELRGIEYVNDKFLFDLKGQLSPCQQHGETYLKGLANLAVAVELPPPLNFMPRPLIETTGNGLLLSVLTTIKQRLMQQLLTDYRNWVAVQVGTTSVQDSVVLKPLN
ncbi:MAG: DUF1997 domain-containing protein [Leptolyngbya sp. UWPOB_LEPTO1]|uniref:DUF1997 domain-containing protein n=1 Tax=Leptolyngbya sp. UWPOB_LEPTO1 TaxID=2815653 RepID=UPI001ACD5002|nr:DUF1997 domain-containing protein [Leptolyngbya sp. UWPOB_LEPTO1]MBN8562609.1 DUF1997 domain-containing protein [Leptolyngbya sp. UWPOB_LEPTO1]